MSAERERQLIEEAEILKKEAEKWKDHLQKMENDPKYADAYNADMEAERVAYLETSRLAKMEAERKLQERYQREFEKLKDRSKEFNNSAGEALSWMTAQKEKGNKFDNNFRVYSDRNQAWYVPNANNTEMIPYHPYSFRAYNKKSGRSSVGKSRKSLSKSVRKAKKSTRKSVRKSTRKVKKSTRKSVRKSVRKAKKSTRKAKKSTRKVKKSTRKAKKSTRK